jgi:hypothetical protein
MGLRGADPREGALKRGGVWRVECIIGVPVGIEELPSRADERGYSVSGVERDRGAL